MKDYSQMFMDGELLIKLDTKKQELKSALLELGLRPIGSHTFRDYSCITKNGRNYGVYGGCSESWNDLMVITAEEFLKSLKKKTPLEYYFEDYLGYKDGDKITVSGWVAEYYVYNEGKVFKPNSDSEISSCVDFGDLLTLKYDVELYEEPKLELTLDEIAEKFGVKVENLKIKK